MYWEIGLQWNLSERTPLRYYRGGFYEGGGGFYEGGIL